MTDVVFNLLIFFMLTSTLVHPNALKLLLPKGSNITSAKPLTTVSVTSDLKYYVEEQQVNIDDLEGSLKRSLEINLTLIFLFMLTKVSLLKML